MSNSLEDLDLSYAGDDDDDGFDLQEMGGEDQGEDDQLGYTSVKELKKMKLRRLKMIASSPVRRRELREAAKAEIERRLGGKYEPRERRKGLRRRREEAREEAPVETEGLEEESFEESSEEEGGDELGAVRRAVHPVIWKAAKSKEKLNDAERDRLFSVLRAVSNERLREIAQNPARSVVVKERVYDELLRRKRGGQRVSWSAFESGGRGASMPPTSSSVVQQAARAHVNQIPVPMLSRRRPTKTLPVHQASALSSSGVRFPIAPPGVRVAPAMKSSAQILHDLQDTTQARARAAQARAEKRRAEAREEAAEARVEKRRAEAREAQKRQQAQARARQVAMAERGGSTPLQAMAPRRLAPVVRPVRPASPPRRVPPPRGAQGRARPARLGAEAAPSAPAGFELQPKLGSAMLASPFKTGMLAAAVFALGAWVGKDRIQDAAWKVSAPIRHRVAAFGESTGRRVSSYGDSFSRRMRA